MHLDSLLLIPQLGAVFNDEVKQMASRQGQDSACGQPRWLNEKQVAELTGISLSTLRKHRFFSEGLPYYKVGRSVRYKHSDVISFMEARRIEPRR